MAQMVKHLPTVQESWVRSLGREDPLEREMATHSSIIAWKTPWMEEHRKWQPTPAFLPGKPHGWRSIVGYNPWDHKELDMNE